MGGSKSRQVRTYSSAMNPQGIITRSMTGTNPLKVVELNCANCGKRTASRNGVSEMSELSERGLAEGDIRVPVHRLQADLFVAVSTLDG